MPKHYQVLGLKTSATPAEIKERYWELAKHYHPDRNTGDTAAEEYFKEISVAYEILGDETKRQLYHEKLIATFAPEYAPEASNRPVAVRVPRQNPCTVSNMLKEFAGTVGIFVALCVLSILTLMLLGMIFGK